LPKATIGRRPDEPVDADRLAGTVVDELDLGLLDQDRLAVRPHLEFHHARRADHLLGRDAVDALGEHAHDLLRRAVVPGRQRVGLGEIIQLRAR